MIPIIDARSGKLVKVGETWWYPPTQMLDGSKQRSGCKLEEVHSGVLSAQVKMRVYDGPREYVSTVRVPIKFFPKLTYGPKFPVDATRAIVLPS